MGSLAATTWRPRDLRLASGWRQRPCANTSPRRCARFAHRVEHTKIGTLKRFDDHLRGRSLGMRHADHSRSAMGLPNRVSVASTPYLPDARGL